MIRIKSLHTRIFNNILSLVTKPQCGISVYVSHRVLLTHCQEPLSGRPTELVCGLMPWWLFTLDPRCSAFICCTACFIVLTNLHARIEPVAGWKMSLVGWEKNWKTQEWQNPWIFLLVQSLFYSIVLPFLRCFFFFCWCSTLGQRDTVLLLASIIKASSVVKVKRRNGRQRDLITEMIYSMTSLCVRLSASRSNVKPPSSSSLLIHFMGLVPPCHRSLRLTFLFRLSHASLNFEFHHTDCIDCRRCK